MRKLLTTRIKSSSHDNKAVQCTGCKSLARLFCSHAYLSSIMPKFFVFDVESIGLHGEAFAVAWVVVDRDGTTLEEGCYSCPPEYARGLSANRKWVADNVPPLQKTHEDPRELRQAFWEKWTEWSGLGTQAVADCPWPVEAKFLSACVDDDLKKREWRGPYPLLDLGSIMLSIGLDPLESHDRLPNEIPAHHPLCDARQSARLLIDSLNKVTPTAVVTLRLVSDAGPKFCDS